MTLLFGLSFIASKQALAGIGIFQLVFSRYLIALILLTIIVWRDRKKFYIVKRDRRQFLLLTLVEPVGYFIFETLGVKYTTPSSVSLIIATIPVFSLIFAFWIIKEKFHWQAVIGITISFLGVYFIVSRQSQTVLAPFPVLGNLFALGAAVSAGLYNVLCRRLTQTYSPLTITYYQSIVATIIFLPLAVGESFLRSSILIDWPIILSVLYLGIGSSVLAYLILNFTLSRLPTYRVAIYANLIPVVTILASWLIFNELLQFLQLAGAGLIIGGIYLTTLQFNLNKNQTAT